MTVIQQYRHIRVLPAETHDGTDRYHPADRAALIKKALALVYGPSVGLSDPVSALALLTADVSAAVSHLQIDPALVNNKARSYRSEHNAYASSQPEE